MIQFAHGKEQPFIEATRVQRGQYKRRVAESPELFAEDKGIERAILCRRQLHLADDGDGFAPRLSDQLERTPC